MREYCYRFDHINILRLEGICLENNPPFLGCYVAVTDVYL